MCSIAPATKKPPVCGGRATMLSRQIAHHQKFESQRSGLNRRPLDYESSALPLSYAGTYALERTRTATPFGTTPSRWRVYQFHHQGSEERLQYGADGARTRDLRCDRPAL